MNLHRRIALRNVATAVATTIALTPLCGSAQAQAPIRIDAAHIGPQTVYDDIPLVALKRQQKNALAA